MGTSLLPKESKLVSDMVLDSRRLKVLGDIPAKSPQDGVAQDFVTFLTTMGRANYSPGWPYIGLGALF